MLLDTYPIWLVALLVFALRVTDVCMGTIRTISVVRGHLGFAMMLGFVEVSIWVLAVTQVVAGIRDHPILVVAYASGFATGTAAGITLERKLALGTVVVRMISRLHPEQLTAALHDSATGVTTFAGTGIDGSRTLLYASCARRDLKRLLNSIHEVDPQVFHMVERFSQTGIGPPPHPTGWRAVFKKK